MEEKKNRHIIANSLLFIVLVSSIANFIIILLFDNDKNLLINAGNSLLICIFSIFYIFSCISNTRKKKNYIVISSLIFILFNAFSISTTLNVLTFLELPHVEDFTNKSLVDVIKWSEKNKVDIEQVYEYSDTVDEYKVINQSITPSTILKNVKTLTVTVSEGPDPDKEVIIPDMEGWDADRVLEYVLNNNLGNVNVEFIESDKNKDTLIEQSKSGNVRRSDEIILKFSLGDQELDSVKLMNLSKKSLFEAEFYLKRNGIVYDVEKQFSTKVGRNFVIKTDKTPGTMIKPKDENSKVKIVASKGKKIKVPNLKKYDMLKITEWVIKNKLKLEFDSKYDDSIKENKVISVNYNKGDIIEQKTLISVIISKGKLVMKDFKTVNEFKDWADKYEINYEEKFEFSNDIDEGKIISFSHKVGDTIKNDDIVTITISQGKKTKVPNVIGDSKTEAISKLKSANIKYNFVYDYSTKEKNTVIKQSLSAGSEVGENTTITLTLSNGKKPTTSTNNSYSSSKNTNNNSSSGNSSSNTSTCDRSKGAELNIQPGNTGAQTKTMIQSMNNHKFNFKMVSSCSNGDTSSGTVCEQLDGVWKNYCDTITITIVQ